jgi:nuclear GTP-binding protein
LDISSIYLRSDENLLSQVLPRRELRKQRGNLVQLKDAVLDERKVDLESIQMIEDDQTEDSDDDGDEGDEMSEDEDDNEGTDEDVDDEDTSEDSQPEESSQESHIEPPLALPALSGKKKREQGRHVGKGPTNASAQKRVSFVPYTKAGAKARPLSTKSERKAFKSSNVSVMTGKKVTETGNADAYDFTKYF